MYEYNISAAALPEARYAVSLHYDIHATDNDEACRTCSCMTAPSSAVTVCACTVLFVQVAQAAPALALVPSAQVICRLSKSVPYTAPPAMLAKLSRKSWE